MNNELQQLTDESCEEFRRGRKSLNEIIRSALETVRTETLAECRAATETQICDLQDKKMDKEAYVRAYGRERQQPYIDLDTLYKSVSNPKPPLNRGREA